MGSKKKKSDFLIQGSILAFASIISRLIGLVYRVPMTNIIGTGGIAIYSVAFEIYGVVLILSSYSLPLAVSKMIAVRTIKKEYRNAHKIFREALIFAIVVGSIGCLVVYFGANALESIYNMEGVAKPLRILAPTIFVMAIIGVLRGFFQGKSTMMPTAISQILEQIINAIVSVWAAYAFMKSHSASETIEAYGAAGGTLGTLMGAITAFVFLIFVYSIYRPTLRKQIRRDKVSQVETANDIYRMLILTIIPVILSQTVYQISGTIDSIIFGHVMDAKGMLDNVRRDLLGVYSGQYRLMVNVPVAISSAMASSLIPSLVASKTQGDKKILKEKVACAVKFNMLIGIPCAVGLSVLAKPILSLLFPSLKTYSNLAATMLMTGSIAVVFYALSTITSAVLQGINHMRLPVIHSAISLGLHIILVFALLQFTNAGVYALVIGNVTFPLVVCILNWISVGQHLKYKQEIKRTFLLPTACSAIMGIVVFGVYQLIHKVLHSNVLGIIVSMGIGIIVYFIAVLVLKCFKEDELHDMPLGRTIARVAKKIHLM